MPITCSAVIRACSWPDKVLFAGACSCVHPWTAVDITVQQLGVLFAEPLPFASHTSTNNIMSTLNTANT